MSSKSRIGHWVIRVSDLKSTLKFYKEVFGLVTIRHEENEAACGMTCNGRFDRPWSKTMVGYPEHYEDAWFCLELTYNYGIKSYKPDTGFKSFSMASKDPPATLSAAKELGYEIQNDCEIIGPDSYVYRVEACPNKREEPFLAVNLRAMPENFDKLKKFYCDVLGMLVDETADKLVFSYDLPSPENQVPICFVAPDAGDEGVVLDNRSGRLAIFYHDVETSYKQIPAETVIHEMGILKDKLGDLFIAIVKDPQGYEVCLVTKDVIEAATRDATDWKEPDWDLRQQKGAKPN